MREDYIEEQAEFAIDDEEDWLDDEPLEEVPRAAGRKQPVVRERPAARERVVKGAAGDSQWQSAWRRQRRDRQERQEDRQRRERRRRSDRDDHSSQRENSRSGGSNGGAGSVTGDLIMLAFKIGLVAVFLLFMTTFFYGITQVRDTSMEPAIKEGDLVIYYRPDRGYTSGDAIVVDYNGSLQVRRVVAVAGDTVDISADGGLIINDALQIEDDIYTSTYPYTDGITFPVTVGESEVFVLGDDRTNAEDSRMYGTVRVSATKGSVMTVIRRRGI